MKTSQETVLDVQGMTCSSCVRHVEGALRELEGVGGVEVDLRGGKVRVRHDGQATIGQMIEALSEAGYESRSSSS